MKLKKMIGFVLILAAVLFFSTMIYSESNSPGYSAFSNLISELGVGKTAGLFNSTAIITGFALVVLSYFFFKALKKLFFSILFAITGLGIAGVGLFPLTTGLPHEVSAFAAFFGGGLTAVYSAKFFARKIAYVFAFLGFFSLIALGLFALNLDFGLGIGLLERLIVYPFLIWAIIFGIALIWLNK